MPGDPTVEALLAPATFTPLYGDWLGVREAALAARFRALAGAPARRVLLVNATLGLPLYPSVVDFFALLQRAQPAVRVTSASYFDTIYQLGDGVARKGLAVVAIADVAAWTTAEVNRFDVVLAVGPSDALAALMARPGLTARLVCLDLGFYHQLIESTAGAFLDDGPAGPPRAAGPAPPNGVTCYSCQPQRKVTRDLDRFFALERFAWRWFNYIPVGFAYGAYYRSDRALFDVALLGSGGRSYADLDPAALRGARCLFLGAPERAPGLARLRAALDVTVVPRVDEATYGRLLAACRCVVLPIAPASANVLLSVVDALASGKALVTPRRDGLARLEREGAPIVFYDGAADLSATVGDLLRDAARLDDLGARTLAFAQAHMDIYGILETILREQVLPDAP